jgi:hypothetical protein
MIREVSLPASTLPCHAVILRRRPILPEGGMGPAVEGLEIWHQSALSRFALDKALADLAAAIVGMVG